MVFPSICLNTSSNVTSTLSSTPSENSSSCTTVVKLVILSVGCFCGAVMASAREGSCCWRLSRTNHSEGDVRLGCNRLNLPNQHNSKAYKTLLAMMMLM